MSVQLYYSQQAAEHAAPGHLLGIDRYGQVGPIKMVGEGGGGDFPNVDVIAVGGNAAADSDKESASASRSEQPPSMGMCIKGILVLVIVKIKSEKQYDITICSRTLGQ